MICPSYTSFRWTFGTRIRSAITATLTVGPSPTITRAAGDFTADGWVAGMRLVLAGCSDPTNNKLLTVASIGGGGTVIVCAAADTLVAEGPTAGVVAEGGTYALDGMLAWPIANLRAGGFSGGLGSLLPPAFTDGTTIRLTANAQVADASLGVDEYDWWAALQGDPSTWTLGGYLTTNWTFTPEPPAGGSSYSGTVRMVVTGGLDFPGMTVLTPDAIGVLFRNVHVYCQRRSDGAIQWIDLLAAALP